MNKVKIILSLLILIISIIVYAGAFSKEFPIQNYNPQYPESAWGAIFAKNIVTRIVNKKLIAVNPLKINGVSANPGEGPFNNVSQTYAIDFNNDGFADVVSVTYDGKVVIKENKGFDKNGKLIIKDITSYVLPIKAGDGSMVVDDFDNDGKLDLFLYNSWGYAQFVSNVIENPEEKEKGKNIASKFIYYSYYGFKTKWTVSAMISYDYNKDGYKDIIYADMRGRVWVWLNDKNKGINRFFNQSKIILLFSDPPTIGTNASEGGAVIDLSDVNNDGIPDIIAGNTDKRNIVIYFGKMVNNTLVFDPNNKLYIIKPDGGLGPTTSVDLNIPNSKNPLYLPSFAPTIIKVTDLDRDGFRDVLVGTDAWRQGKNFGGSIYLFKGNGLTLDNKPKFISIELVHGSYSSQNNPPYDFDAGTIADLDNDGLPDFVAADGNHSGNYYKIMLKTTKEYVTDRGILISNYLPNIVGIKPHELPLNFIKKITIEIEFDENLGSGFFELRYIRSGIRNPKVINVDDYPLFPNTNIKMPIKNYLKTTVEFNTPTPDPQVIIILYPESISSAPHLTKIKYTVETEPARVIIKGFNWTKGE